MDNKTTVIIGIDPGQSGGMAVIAKDGAGWVDVVPFKDKTEHDLSEIVLEYASSYDCFAYLENVHSMPKQGVSSSFKFGMHFGFLIGLLTGHKIPYIKVTPQMWQKNMGCLSHGDKNVTKSKAQQLWPSRKITHAIADAMLIADYGRQKQCGTLLT